MSLLMPGTPVSSLTITRLGERYREGLLDDEVSIYTCRVISNNVISGDSVRDISDPVCYSLLHGDERVSTIRRLSIT